MQAGPVVIVRVADLSSTSSEFGRLLVLSFGKCFPLLLDFLKVGKFCRV